MAGHASWLRPDALRALDDATLCDLIRVACAEAFRRGEAVASRARDGLLTEAERTAVREAARDAAVAGLRAEEVVREAVRAAEEQRRAVERAQAQEAAEKERRLWALKKGTALAVAAAFPDETGLTVSVWQGYDRERRVYIGRGFGANTVTYYATGNRRHPPGSVETFATLRPRSGELARLCAAIAKAWTGVRIDVDQAVSWPGEATPLAIEATP